MKNLEQIRARNVLKKAGIPIPGKQKGEVVKKIPPMIINHGLLATGADAFAEEGHKEVFNRIAEHLSDNEVGLVPSDCNSAEKLMEFLSKQADSHQLKLCTVEAMAWLNYARRFIKKG